MKLKKETQYAIKALKALYTNRDTKLLQAKEIAKLENIPIKFLYLILRKLKENNLIVIERGVSGGYMVTKEIDSITVYGLLKIMEGDISLSFYDSCEENNELNLCSVANTFVQIDKGIKIALDNIKLIDILK